MLLHYALSPLIILVIFFIYPILPLIIKGSKMHNRNTREKLKGYIEPYSIVVGLFLLFQYIKNFNFYPNIYSHYFLIVIILLTYIISLIFEYEWKIYENILSGVIFSALIFLCIISIILGILNSTYECKYKDNYIEENVMIPDLTQDDYPFDYEVYPKYSNGTYFFCTYSKVIEYDETEQDFKDVKINYKHDEFEFRKMYPKEIFTVINNYIYYEDELYKCIALNKGVLKGFEFEKYILFNRMTGEYTEYKELPDFAK